MKRSRPRCNQKVCQENWTPPSPWQATILNRCPGSLLTQHQAWYRVWQHCLEWPQFLRCCTLRAIKQKRCPDLPRELLLARAGLPSLGTRRRMAQCTLIRKAYLRRHPRHLQRALSPWLSPGKRRQSPRTSPLSKFSAQTNPSSKLIQRSPLFQAATTWNRFVAAKASRDLPSARDISNFFDQ